MNTLAIRELRNNPSELTHSLEHDEYVFITKYGKTLGVAIPLSDENLSFGLTRATALQAWRNGAISLGKMAELLNMDKTRLRQLLAELHLPVFDSDVDDVAEEAAALLDDMPV